MTPKFIGMLSIILFGFFNTTSHFTKIFSKFQTYNHLNLILIDLIRKTISWDAFFIVVSISKAIFKVIISKIKNTDTPIIEPILEDPKKKKHNGAKIAS
jgi:hypothetical protein